AGSANNFWSTFSNRFSRWPKSTHTLSSLRFQSRWLSSALHFSTSFLASSARNTLRLRIHCQFRSGLCGRWALFMFCSSPRFGCCIGLPISFSKLCCVVNRCQARNWCSEEELRLILEQSE